jgi:hypothetical protein
MNSTTKNEERGRGRYWWIKINISFKSEWIKFKNILDLEDLKFYRVQVETLENNNSSLHIQGIIGYKKAVRKSTIKYFLSKCTWSISPEYSRLKTESEVSQKCYYCENKATVVNEFGKLEKGFLTNRHDKETRKNELAELIANINQHGEIKASADAARANISVKQWRKAVAEHNFKSRAIEKEKQMMDSVKMLQTTKPWQQKLLLFLSENPDPRKILVILDKKGGQGKTWMVRTYAQAYPETTVHIINGKTADLTYVATQKKNRRVIFYTIHRSGTNVNYSVMEQLKDNCFVNVKYRGNEIFGNPPHMVVFTNMPLTWRKLSEDRSGLCTVYFISNYLFFTK